MMSGAGRQVELMVYPRGRAQVWGAINSSNDIQETDFLRSEGHEVSEEPAFGHLPQRLQWCQPTTTAPFSSGYLFPTPEEPQRTAG